MSEAHTALASAARDASALPVAGGCYAQLDKEMTMIALTPIERAAHDASLHALALDDNGRSQYAVAYDLGDGRANVVYTDTPAIAAPVAECAVALAGVIVRSIAGYEQYVGNRSKQALESINVKTPTKYEEPRLHQAPDMADALESTSDRAGVSGVGKAANESPDVVNVDADDDAGKFDVVTIMPAVENPSPEAGGRGDGKADYPRFHPMKGFSKIQRKIWHWLDEHAADVSHKYPTQRDVAEAVGTTHPTAGKYLQQWRNHNGITKPEFYQDQAS
jgi:hypothetical protein